MPAFIVSYDLHKEGQNYDCIIKKLEAYGTYSHMQRSVWIIVTSQSAKQIKDNLSPCLDSNDKLFVGGLTGEMAWKNIRDKTAEWLKKHT